MFVRRIWPGEETESAYDQLDDLRQQMDRFLVGLRGSDVRRTAGVYPPLNVTQDDDNLYVRAELPGVSADKLDVSTTGKTLTIAGSREIPPVDEAVLVEVAGVDDDPGILSRCPT